MFGVRLEKKTNVFALDQLSAQTEEASELLARALDHNGNGSQNHLNQIRPITEECHAIVRQVSERLKHTFMSALDREDIYNLVMSVTGVQHRLDKFAGRFSRYQPSHSPSQMIRMADLIHKMVREIGEVLPVIERRNEILPRLEAIHEMHREGGEIYLEAVSTLLQTDQSPTNTLMYKDLYDQMESIIGSCRQVGSLAERISIKHA